MPTAALSRCLEYGCAAWAVRRGRCEDHAPKPWERSSAHNKTMTRNESRVFRRAVLRRDPVCRTCGIAPSTEADHVLPVADGGARHDVANGLGLCTPCHDIKTRAENAVRNRARGQNDP
jgi:5-methylcytosine-specific restriction protein A